MYKFLNWLFLWDYVHWTGTGGSQGISRVRLSAEEEPYIYWNGQLCKLEWNHNLVWLTCKREKYLKEEVE